MAILCCLTITTWSGAASRQREAPAQTAPTTQTATPAQIARAIQDGVANLYAHQADGNWEQTQSAPTGADATNKYPGQFTGRTAIAIYALLCAGESPENPHIAAAVDFLAKNPAIGVYAAAARCLVWSRMDLKGQLRASADKDVHFLLAAQRTKGSARGMYYYFPPTSADEARYDHSASQLAVLGLGALSHAGFEIPTGYWKTCDEAWRSHQYPNGSWSYIYNGTPETSKQTVSMTAAGIATLFITRSMLQQTAGCDGNTQDESIAKGIKWLGENFDTLFDTSHEMNGTHFERYALFAVSRVGVASGYRNFGTVDWYQRGVDYLVAKHKLGGSWVSSNESLALLFLSYGSAPVVMAKLEYSLAPAHGPAPIANWNQRPQDLANFTEWMGGRLERRLNWEILNLASSSADALHDAPILQISGNQILELSEQDRTKLRQFVEEGGMILGNADCDSKAFANTFIKLGSQLFPSYEFRELPANHPIFANEQYNLSKSNHRISMRGLSNGVRELMLLPGQDLSRALETRAEQTRAEMYQLADDIVLYAVETTRFRSKGSTYLVNEDSGTPVTRETKLARLQYSGNWDPEPGGWRRMKAVLHNSYGIGLDVQPMKITDPGLSGFSIAHLTGTAPLKLGDDERRQLLDFVHHGGTLVIDAAGGSTEFAASAEQILKDAFAVTPTQLQSPLPSDDPLFQLPSHKLEGVSYRAFARRAVGNLAPPRLCGIRIGQRLAIIYSREDLSAGLVGEPMDGIVGYTPKSATELMADIISHAATGSKR